MPWHLPDMATYALTTLTAFLAPSPLGLLARRLAPVALKGALMSTPNIALYINLAKAAFIAAKGVARVTAVQKDASLTPEQKKEQTLAEVGADLPQLLPLVGVPAEFAAVASDAQLLGFAYDGVIEVEHVVEQVTHHDAAAPAQ